jgi:hypothetical protein
MARKGVGAVKRQARSFLSQGLLLTILTARNQEKDAVQTGVLFLSMKNSGRIRGQEWFDIDFICRNQIDQAFKRSRIINNSHSKRWCNGRCTSPERWRNLGLYFPTLVGYQDFGGER